MAPPRKTWAESLETAKGRIADKVELIPFSACHYFVGCVNANGYGLLSMGRKNYKAHRIAYEIAHGPIPEGGGYHGTVVRHTCDTPCCVNPAHLVLGTQQDNLADKVSKGRQYRGERHHARKLADEDVVRIKQRIAHGERNASLATEYGVVPSVVSMIRTGRAHANIAVGG